MSRHSHRAQYAHRRYRYIVVDGTIITTDEIILNGTGHVADVHVMMGNMRDDGAAFIGYPVCGPPPYFLF